MGLSLFFILLSALTYQAIDPDQYRWENRLLIVVDNRVETPGRSEQFRSFQDRDSSNRERDLLLITLSGNSVWLDNVRQGSNASLWRDHFNISPQFRGLLLIGKDGGIKFTSTEHTETQTIYDLIDSMPMRQQEMRNKN